jgi:hypothetical protein
LGLSARAFAVEEVNQQVGEVAVGQLLGGDVADERVYLGRRALVLLRERGLDRLGSCVRYDFGDALGLGELLRELHHQARDGDAARGPQELGLVGVLHAHCGRPAHHVFGVRLHVVALEVGQLLLELAHLVLQVHDVVAGDLAALGGVIVLAVRVGALAGPASGQPRVASRLALDGSDNNRVKIVQGVRPTVRQRQHAVRVWAVRFWVPSSGCGAASVFVCVAVATSMALSPGRRARSRAYDAMRRAGYVGRSTRTSMTGSGPRYGELASPRPV